MSAEKKLANGYYWAFHADGSAEPVEVSGNRVILIGNGAEISTVAAYEEMLVTHLVGPLVVPYLISKDNDLFGIPQKGFMNVYRMSEIADKEKARWLANGWMKDEAIHSAEDEKSKEN